MKIEKADDPIFLNALKISKSSRYKSAVCRGIKQSFHASTGQHSQARPQADVNTDTFDEPEIRIRRNINLNFGNQMPLEIKGALRSVMEMFSGASPSANRPEDTNGRSAPS
ncbi:hypothetical protein Acr_11g0007230 [Actinidia rufa]|uniref:Uncharacterized protein n=1 Tax=Actinidia rufa TaxID=165716 RepID=A0A7J0FEU0_9ERIC|nr:hypothetical protein Acr_11g0007230 [Actinidia rufa]